jgi:hypothetical protein
MPTLTRRRYPERPDCWHIYYGDVRVGTIARRVGNPFDTDPWEWTCGFYPGSHPGECTSDTSETFDQARTEFEAAWQCSYRSEPRPIFRNGVISGIGRLRNIAASIEASACHRTGSRSAPRRADQISARLDAGFDNPIPLPSGRQLVTLKEAANYIQKLSKAEQDLEAWQAAVEALLLVVELNGPTMMAGIGLLRALNRNVQREFDTSRKDTHWGRRKRKLDE